MPTVEVHFFASSRHLAGGSTLLVDVPSDGLTAAELIRRLSRERPRLTQVLRSSRFLKNDRYLDDLGVHLAPGDIFSVHPPYGGG